MRTTIFRLAIAVALAVGAWMSRGEAQLAERRAEAALQIATFRYADVDRGAGPATAATAAYWLGQYGDVTADGGDGTVDAEVLRMAANAAFREQQRHPAAGPAGVQQLDGVLQAYASALKATSRDADAAYNYEFVARIRDQVARASQGKGATPAAPAAAAGAAGDLPAGPTIHGRPGMPPPDAKMEDLQMIAPMEFGDREAQPEATPGGKRERKG